MTDRNVESASPKARHQRAEQEIIVSSSQDSAVSKQPTAQKSSQKKSSRIPKRKGQSSKAPKSSSSRRSSSKSTSRDPVDGRPQGRSPAIMPGVTDAGGEITYTPTTHRISKAKKGKPVHVCEHHGCGKVFTRAEHRKRHEANHRPEPLFRCSIEECKKPFQRSDLLTRHLERQHGIVSSPMGSSQEIQRHFSRTSSQASSISSSGQTNSPRPSSFVEGPQSNAVGSRPRRPRTTIPIGSIIEPSNRQGIIAPSPQPWGELSEVAPGQVPNHLPSDLVFGYQTSGESPMYSSESCYSPMSEGPQAPNFQSYLPQFEKPCTEPSSLHGNYQTQLVTSPLSAAPSFPTWHASETTSKAINGLGIYEGQFQPPVDSTTPIPISDMERYGWTALRAGLSSTSGLGVQQNGMVDVKGSHLEQCLELYWQHVHHVLPIIHRPTFSTSSDAPLPTAAMIALGAQLSTRPDVRAISKSMYDFSIRILATRDSINSHSPLPVLQTVVLLEAFSLYYLQTPFVQKSQYFSNLCSNLVNDHEYLDMDSNVFLNRLRGDAIFNQHIQIAHTQWIDRETRRRILLAAFILDTQRTKFFEQPACQQFTVGTSLNLPIPSCPGAWESSDPEIWRDLLCSPPQVPLSIFQSALLQCQSVYRNQPLPSLSHHSQAFLTHQSLLLASSTPITALLLTASESWLLGQKVTHLSTWTSAKTNLRAWVSSDAADHAVWHATTLIRAAFRKRLVLPADDEDDDEDDDDREQEFGSESRPVRVLHENWCLFLAALVCWAYGFSPQQVRKSGTPQHDYQPLEEDEREEELWAYLDGVEKEGREGVRRAMGKGATRAVLEGVKEELSEWDGGIACECRGVLRKLAEGRSGLVCF